MIARAPGPNVEFWSSVEYRTFQQALVRELRRANWPAEHKYQISLDRYWRARSRTARLRLRFQAYLMYPVNLYVQGRLRPRGIRVVSTNTFYAPRVAAGAARRENAAMVHWVLDLFPDVLTLAGVLKEGSWAERGLRRLIRDIFDRAAANVFLGEHLLQCAERRFGPIPRSVVIPIGCDAEPFSKSQPALRADPGPARILYCGNLGRMHDVETVAGLMRGGLPPGVRIDFRGNGPAFGSLERLFGDKDGERAISFGGNLKEADWIREMLAADVALVTVKPGAEAVVMPSKTYSALAAGQAVVAVCPAVSDLAATIRRHECGWVIEPGDVEGLRATIQAIARDPAELFRRRRRAWLAARDHYDQSAIVGSWIKLLEGIAEGRR